MKCIRHSRLESAIAGLLACGAAIVPVRAQVSTARAVLVTDVTPRSFALVWLAAPGTAPDARVFEGPACEVAASDARVFAFPSLSGGPGLAQAAANRGVMKVLVSGLSPDTTYCVQAVSTVPPSTTSEIFPLTPLPVRTAASTRRSGPFDELGQAPSASNDLLRFAVELDDPTDSALGALIFARIDGALSPVTGFIGDGIEADTSTSLARPRVLLDLNNLYADGATSPSLDLQGGVGERITLLEFGRGGTVVPAHGRVVPLKTRLAAIVDPDSCFEATGGVCDGVLGGATGDIAPAAADAEVITRRVVNASAPLVCAVCADANHDGLIDMRDALIVAQVAARLRLLP